MILHLENSKNKIKVDTWIPTQNTKAAASSKKDNCHNMISDCKLQDIENKTEFFKGKILRKRLLRLRHYC